LVAARRGGMGRKWGCTDAYMCNVLLLKLSTARRLTRRMSNLKFFLLEIHMRSVVPKFQVQTKEAPRHQSFSYQSINRAKPSWRAAGLRWSSRCSCSRPEWRTPGAHPSTDPFQMQLAPPQRICHVPTGTASSLVRQFSPALPAHGRHKKVLVAQNLKYLKMLCEKNFKHS